METVSKRQAGGCGDDDDDDDEDDDDCCPGSAFRNVDLEWKEFFGSSLSLSAGLIAVYDEISRGISVVPYIACDSVTVTDTAKSLNAESRSDVISLGLKNHQLKKKGDGKKNFVGSRFSVSMDSDGARQVHKPMIVETPKADNNSVSVGSTMDVRGRPRDGVDSGYCFSSSHHHSSVSPDADDRKRPLSIASNSSSASSSSSLPRHVRKRIANMSSSSAATTGCSSSADSGVSNASCEMLSTVVECGSPVDPHRPSSSGGGVFDQAFDNALRSNRSSAEGVPLSSPCRYDSSVTDDYLGNSDVEESAGSSERNSCDCLNGSESKLLTGVAYIERVVAEILETERSYVKDLSDLVQGYTYQLKNDIKLEVSRSDIDTLFGNIETIWKFNRHFLSRLEQCGQDPVKIAACFVSEICGFEIYSTYCTNYPRSVETLMKMMKDEKVANILKKQQMSLQHSLPLGSYLLKPVQRILKYHILLQNIFNNHDTSDEGHSIIEEALDSMMSVAQNINEMKRQHEHAVRLQEIQCHLGDWDGTDLMTLGGLILEERFRVCGAKALRRLFLFEKAILLTKEREDGILLVKSFILFSNLMVIESVPKEPLSFQLIPYDAPRDQITLQASSLEQKRSWCQWIKRLMLENYGPKIPDKAKELVMKLGKSREEEDFESSNMETPELVKKQHNAPAYLEKRKGRRKSTGFIHDLKLKPRKGLRSRLSSSDASKPQTDGSHSHGRNSIDVLPVTDDEESVSCGDDCEKAPSDRGSSGSCSYAREISASDLYKRDGSFSSQSSYSPATTPVGKTRGNIKSSFSEGSGSANGESSAVAGSGLENSCEKQSQSSSSLGKLPEEFVGRHGDSFHRSSSAGGELHRVVRNASWADSDAVDDEGETIASGNYQIKWYRSLRKPGSGCHVTSRDSTSGSVGSRLIEETPIADSEAANDGDVAPKRTVTSSYSCTTLPSQENIASNCNKHPHAPKISDNSPKTLDPGFGVKSSRSLVSDLAREVIAGNRNDLEDERNSEGECIVGSVHGTSTRPAARIPAESYQDFCSHTTIRTRVSGSGSSSEKVETLSIKSEDRKETRTRLATLLGRSASGREQTFRFPSEGCSQTSTSLGEFLKDRHSLIRECMANSPSQMFDSLFTMTNRTAHHRMPLSGCRQTLNLVQTEQPVVDSNGLAQPTGKTSPTQRYEVKIVKLQPESDTVFIDVDPAAGKLFSQNSGIEGGNDAEFYYENKLLQDLEDGCKTDDDDDDDGGGSLTVKSDDVPRPSANLTELSSRMTKCEPSNPTEYQQPVHAVEVKLSKKARGIQEILHTLENVARNGHSGSSTYYSRVVHRTVRDRSRDRAIRASVTRVRHNDSNIISVKSETVDEDYSSRSNNSCSENAGLTESLQTESRTTRL